MQRGTKGSHKSAEACRATAMLCRQQAAYDPDNSWRLLGEAERWEYLAEQLLASRQQAVAAEGPLSAMACGLPAAAPASGRKLAKSTRFG